MKLPLFEIKIAGDSALNLVFSDTTSPETSTAIRQAADQLSRDPIPGIIEMIPTFCSLMICYDPMKIGFDELVANVRTRLTTLGGGHVSQRKIIHIPVCYGGKFGPDLDDVARYHHLSPDEVIKIHSSKDYLIDMLGFLPGFAYLGGLDKRLETPRLETPRTRIEAGSVGIGGSQTGVYPLPSPGGWRLIGRTPIRPYDPNRDKPILYSAGEFLHFDPVDENEYKSIAARVEDGTYECTTEVKEA